MKAMNNSESYGCLTVDRDQEFYKYYYKHSL